VILLFYFVFCDTLNEVKPYYFMKQLVFIFSLIALPILLSAQSVEGLWRTKDDVTGKDKSIVKIYSSNGKLYGEVVRVITKKKGEVPKCTECSGKLKNANIEGMKIIYGLEKDGKEWRGKDGILDPENGKFYKCRIWLETNDRLAVRGQIGPIGRTQTWYRVK
jgi:uncharacterized protein (DUF2147 family)